MSVDRTLATYEEKLEDPNYHEDWIVIVNGHRYILNKMQNDLLTRAIEENKRGLVTFKDFSIPIPFIQEHYCDKRWWDDLQQLESPEVMEISEEEREENSKKLSEMRAELQEKLKPKHQPLSGEAFKKKKEEALALAKTLTDGQSTTSD